MKKILIFIFLLFSFGYSKADVVVSDNGSLSNVGNILPIYGRNNLNGKYIEGVRMIQNNNNSNILKANGSNGEVSLTRYYGSNTPHYSDYKSLFDNMNFSFFRFNADGYYRYTIYAQDIYNNSGSGAITEYSKGISSQINNGAGCYFTQEQLFVCKARDEKKYYKKIYNSDSLEDYTGSIEDYTGSINDLPSDYVNGLKYFDIVNNKGINLKVLQNQKKLVFFYYDDDNNFITHDYNLDTQGDDINERAIGKYNGLYVISTTNYINIRNNICGKIDGVFQCKLYENDEHFYLFYNPYYKKLIGAKKDTFLMSEIKNGIFNKLLFSVTNDLNNEAYKYYINKNDNKLYSNNLNDSFIININPDTADNINNDGFEQDYQDNSNTNTNTGTNINWQSGGGNINFNTGTGTIGQASFGFIQGLAKNVDGENEDFCAEIFDNNGNFRYSVQSNSSINLSVNPGQSILGERWNLELFGVNVIGWLYDILSAIIEQLVNIFQFFLEKILDLFKFVFEGFVQVEQGHDYCFFGKKIHIGEHITDYYSYNEQKEKHITGKNNIELLFIILSIFYIYKIIRKNV